MAGDAQRQLVRQHQQIAQVGVVHEKAGADTFFRRQPRLFIQPRRRDQRDGQRRYTQHHSILSSRSRAISRA